MGYEMREKGGRVGRGKGRGRKRKRKRNIECLGVRMVGDLYWGRRKEKRKAELLRSFSSGIETDVL